MCVIGPSHLLVLFFFFQAEDGIRDYKVTGVQTCALPIYVESGKAQVEQFDHVVGRSADQVGGLDVAVDHADRKSVGEGKRVDLGGRRIIKKKKKIDDTTTDQ